MRAFVREVVIPAEPRETAPSTARRTELRAELQAAAARRRAVRAAGRARSSAGSGSTMRGQAVVFEEAGYSLLGPLALNCAAPDEGNMHLLEVVATAEQQERYLRPLAAGEVRSCFAMTEPAPGAGSDPSMLRTTRASASTAAG